MATGIGQSIAIGADPAFSSTLIQLSKPQQAMACFRVAFMGHVGFHGAHHDTEEG